MNYPELVNQIKKKKSFLCVGLDTDLNKIPKHLLDTEDPIFEFNKQIIDATKDFCVAYKLYVCLIVFLKTGFCCSKTNVLNLVATKPSVLDRTRPFKSDVRACFGAALKIYV